VNKKAQLSSQMLCCIQESISDECSLYVVTSGETCKIEVKRRTHSVSVSDKPLSLRILISRITIDSMYTVSYKRKTLSEIYYYMTSVNSSVTIFNRFVKLQINALTARGGTSHDVVVSPSSRKRLKTWTCIKQKKSMRMEGISQKIP